QVILVQHVPPCAEFDVLAVEQQTHTRQQSGLVRLPKRRKGLQNSTFPRTVPSGKKGELGERKLDLLKCLEVGEADPLKHPGPPGIDSRWPRIGTAPSQCHPCPARSPCRIDGPASVRCTSREPGPCGRQALAAPGPPVPQG